MILIPAVLTIVVVLAIENSNGVRGGLGPLVHQILTDGWHLVTHTVRSLFRG